MNIYKFLKHPRESFIRYKGREKKIKNKSNKNADLEFFIIRKNWTDGFFANFMFVLDNLIISSERGLIPIVDMQNYKTLYSEDKIIFETRNTWEYYFEQVSPFTLDEVYDSKNIILSSMEYPMYKGLYYNNKNNEIPSKEQIQYLNFILNKYINIKPNIMKKFNEEYKKIQKYNRVLGVHVRGTDMYVEGRHHPVPSYKVKDIKYIKRIILENKIEAILLCSDESKIIDIFKSEFGDKCICTSSLRAKEGSHLGIHVDKSLSKTRDNHNYLLGKEVLIDSLLLSKCNFLLCGPSNVAFASMIFNGCKYENIFYW